MIPERAAAEVWAAVASGLGGRMFEALRDRRSLAYTVLASSWQRGRAGALVTYIATSPEREEEARAAMMQELERFAREPVSESELNQAINYLAGQAEVSRQSAGSLAGEILEAWLIGTVWRISKIRLRRFVRCQLMTCCGSPKPTCVLPRERRVSCEEPESARQSPADHVDSFLHVRRRSGHDVDQADALCRHAVEHDVALQAEQSYGDLAGAFPRHRRAQPGHTNRTCRGHHERGECIGMAAAAPDRPR